MEKYNEKALKENYLNAKKDKKFCALVKKLGLEDETAMKYTSSLERTISEITKCHDCPGLIHCQNNLEGHIFYPEKQNNNLIFSYAPCKYQKEALEQEKNKPTRESELANASMADLDLTDKKRIHVIKWLKKFYDEYNNHGKFKGLYLHGNFGSGKTYFIAALFNELAKKRISTEIVYFPELLRDLKSDFDNFADYIDYLENVDLLLLDDIGAERVTEWGRDEILGPILQKRMNNYKTTFFTSNLTIDELESHLNTNKYSDDEVKARRLVERIKELTEDMELISENRRK